MKQTDSLGGEHLPPSLASGSVNKQGQGGWAELQRVSEGGVSRLTGHQGVSGLSRLRCVEGLFLALLYRLLWRTVVLSGTAWGLTVGKAAWGGQSTLRLCFAGGQCGVLAVLLRMEPLPLSCGDY